MNILYLHQYFKTPAEGGAIRSYYIAKGMVDAGHRVYMITAHNGGKTEIRDIEGILVHYLPVKFSTNMGFYRRIWSFGLFVMRAFRHSRLIQDIDLVYATSTPLSVGLLAYWIKIKRKVPYIFEVRDLWPEAPVQMGFIHNSSLKKILYYLEKKIYQEAEKIIALSPGIEKYIRSRVPSGTIHLVPNMSDIDFFTPGPCAGEMINIAYFGAVGKVNNIISLVKIAKECQRKNLPICFFIAGNGNELDRIRLLRRKLDLRNLEFTGFLDKYHLRNLLNTIDIVYISFSQYPVLETSSPNKFFDALAAGKMIVLNINGWLRHLVESNSLGFYSDPDNPDDFTAKIKTFLSDRNLLEKYKQNSRDLSITFSRRHQLNSLVEKLTGSGDFTTVKKFA